MNFFYSYINPSMLTLFLSFLLIPLDTGFVYEEPEPQPMLVGTASWYDYSLPKYKNGKDRSKTHDTCALRIYERYKKYKVCSKVT